MIQGWGTFFAYLFIGACVAVSYGLNVSGTAAVVLVALTCVLGVLWFFNRHRLRRSPTVQWLLIKWWQFGNFSWVWFITLAAVLAFCWLAGQVVDLPLAATFLVAAMFITLVYTALLVVGLLARIIDDRTSDPARRWKVTRFIAKWSGYRVAQLQATWVIVAAFTITAALIWARPGYWWLFLPYFMAATILTGFIAHAAVAVVEAGWALGGPVKVESPLAPMLSNAKIADPDELKTKGLIDEG